MAIDAEKRRPVLSTITGGMSGAAVKPIALRMVWQVAKAVNIPVIGLGGIMDWKDAVEFMLAGATAIQGCFEVLLFILAGLFVLVA